MKLLTGFLFLLVVFVTPAAVAEQGIKQITVNDFLQQAKAKAIAQGGETNRLIYESSPYLLQHAYNPVQWYAWGEEAFAAAKKLNKPIFLSIGYSTCHWCHVMARESFENKEIATLLNKYFVSIKVDREQRPDIDAVYMSATRLISGHAGWPMTVFLDNDLRPFHAATYYPPFTIDKRTGLKDVLLKIHQLWLTQPETIDEIATKVTARITDLSDDTSEAGVLVKNINDLALAKISVDFDEDYGGFSMAPKFPRPGIFAFLNAELLTDLKRSEIKNKSDNANANGNSAKNMMRLTLDAMASGGIYDQLAGGFHRYSVDRKWHVPHFEKMLYNQALMVMAYSDYYQLDPQQRHRQIVLQTLVFVINEMQSPDGGFYSALDAVSERADNSPVATNNKQAEGAYYLWHESELKKVLSPPEFEFIKKYFYTSENGNIESDPHDQFSNLNIFSVDEDFRNVTLSSQQEKWLVSANKKLHKIRRQRPRPHLDDKVITAWNGMMLAAFAKASVVFNDAALLKPAIQALDFIDNNLYHKQSKKLYRQYRLNQADSAATLADYAWLIYGLLEVYQADGDKRWLNRAIALQDSQNALFLDKVTGAYYESIATDASLLFHSKSIFDGALPSANAIALSNLRRLSQLSDRPEQRKTYAFRAEKLIAGFAASINQHPASASMLLAIELAK